VRLRQANPAALGLLHSTHIKSMRRPAVVSTIFFLIFTAASLRAQQPSIPVALAKLSTQAADPCENPFPSAPDLDQTQRALFRGISDLVVSVLNAPGALSPRDRAKQALQAVERQSVTINASWPNDARLHFELLDTQPALVLKLTFQSHARFFVFAVPREYDNKPNRLWREVGSDDLSLADPVPRSWLNLYPLHRGPTGNARFLAAFGYTGCAGSSAVLYEVSEWDPNGYGNTVQILEQKGAFGMDQAANGARPTAKDPFPPVGKLRTTGKFLALPYCWFSGIDTWDNPSLCALDTHDLSGDAIVFRSRAYNRPELVPLAKAIEFAEQHDFPATRAYTTSDALARRLVREGAPHADAGLTVTRISPNRRRVDMNSATVIVEKLHNRWLILSLTLN
jgi:hypothetical protein